MKTLFVLALLALAATSAIAQLDIGCSPGYGQPLQLQLNPCREFLQQQCSPLALPFLRARLWQLSSCQVMQQQCCRQLRQIAEQSRCQAICGMAQAIVQQQYLAQGFYEPQLQAMRTMALQTLPSMCNVYVPPYCSTTAPYGIATAAACAGGACY